MNPQRFPGVFLRLGAILAGRNSPLKEAFAMLSAEAAWALFAATGLPQFYPIYRQVKQAEKPIEKPECRAGQGQARP